MGQPLRDIERILVKPVFTYADYSCHYVVRRCGIITQMFNIYTPVRGTKRSNTATVIVGILGVDNYTLQQKEAIEYLLYRIEKEVNSKVDVYAIEELEADTPVKLNADPRDWITRRV